MRYYTASGFQLRRLPFGLRLILTLYLLTTLLGFWLASMKYTERELVTPDGVRQYYFGEQSDPLAPPTAKKLSHFVDVTHPHLFAVPLVLLVLCHLVQLCRLPQALKTALYLAAFGGLFATFGTPWVLDYAPFLAPLQILGGASLVLSGTFLCILPLRDLWAEGKSREPDREGT